MTLDSDLLDVHLHASEISPAGVQVLLTDMQRHRSAARAAFTHIMDVVAANETITNVQALKAGLKTIELHIQALMFDLEMEPIDWRELKR